MPVLTHDDGVTSLAWRIHIYLTISDLSYRAFSLMWVHQCYIYGTKENVYIRK